MSKEDYTDQHIGSRIRSKMHNINVNNLSVQSLFFPLHDAILFQGHTEVLLCYPDFNKPVFFHLYTNASYHQLRAVFMQDLNPIAFYS
jgi:hypothetical protein